MNKKTTKIIIAASCVVLAIIIALVATMCGKKPTKEPANASSIVAEGSDVSNSSSNVSETESSSESETSDIDSSIVELPEDYFPEPDPELGNDPLPEEEENEGFEEEPEWEFEDEISYEKYSSIIQCYGKPVKGSQRNVDIDTDYVVYEDFLGFGTNIFPAGLSVAEDLGYNEVFFEFDMTREKYIKPSVGRMMLQVDWMTTDEEPNPLRDDIENNKDYQNYLNGIYDFDTKEMKSVYAYLDKYKEIGTEIELNYAWKTNDDITKWWSLPVALPTASAPMDLDAFAQACTGAIKNFHDRGYGDMVKYLAFFNEPNHTVGDFITVGESEVWNIKMVLTVCKALEKAGLRDTIEVWGPEQGQATISYHNYLRKFSADDEIKKNVDCISFHRYFKPAEFFDDNYYELFHDLIYFSNEFGFRCAITEMQAADTEGMMSETDNYFQDSYTAYIIAAANAGARCALSWGFSEQWLVAPLNFWTGLGVLEATTGHARNAEPVDESFKESAMITNYVDAHSDVLMSEWTGDDIKLTSLRLPDGNYTILLETDNNKQDYDININFSSSINKTFYRISCDRNEENTVDYTVPSVDKEFNNVKNRIIDKLPGKTAAYIYTTKAPMKQISLDKYSAEITRNETVDFSETLIDCEGEIVWSVSAATGEEGKIDKNGVYTPDSNAKKGDCVAIRAALKDDPMVYTTAMVEIVD